MTDVDHRAEAVRLAGRSEQTVRQAPPIAEVYARLAQVHATLVTSGRNDDTEQLRQTRTAYEKCAVELTELRDMTRALLENLVWRPLGDPIRAAAAYDQASFDRVAKLVGYR